MGLTVKEAARYLNLSESTVRKLVSAGRLKAGTEGRRAVIDELDLEAFRKGARGSAPGSNPAPAALREEKALRPPPPRQMTFSDTVVRPVLERLSVLQQVLSDGLDFREENRQLTEEIRKKELELAKRDEEIEKLKRDLMYQKKLFEKELEDYARLLDAKWAIREQEVEDRLAAERAGFEHRLALEKKVLSERMAQQQAKHSASLAEAETGRGFWARIARMLTGNRGQQSRPSRVGTDARKSPWLDTQNGDEIR